MKPRRDLRHGVDPAGNGMGGVMAELDGTHLTAVERRHRRSQGRALVRPRFGPHRVARVLRVEAYLALSQGR